MVAGVKGSLVSLYSCYSMILSRRNNVIVLDCWGLMMMMMIMFSVYFLLLETFTLLMMMVMLLSWLDNWSCQQVCSVKFFSLFHLTCYFFCFGEFKVFRLGLHAFSGRLSSSFSLKLFQKCLDEVLILKLLLGGWYWCWLLIKVDYC